MLIRPVPHTRTSSTSDRHWTAATFTQTGGMCAALQVRLDSGPSC